MLGFGKKEKLARGVELINKVADQFGTMIEELEEGSDDCQLDCRDIGEQIAVLTTRHSFLEKSSSRAVKIAARLKELIGE